ncbi:EAL domain-containing protein [Sulfurivermis fontis]|uniref:EAL domain-containing protein n=1 Tax=Sulfurivermis fontis TaxID=1972068 RepID=UPI000FDABD93|nr:EAL domain-containing protein [Sulfurivermis fontis]
MDSPLHGYSKLSCTECRNGAGLDFDFTMAFQPIVDVATGSVFAQEALVRGMNGEGAGSVLARITDANRYRFDQACRVKSVQLAAQLGITSHLSINFLPNAVYRPELCIRTTLEAAETYGFPHARIIFEVTEGEQITDHAHLLGIFTEYKRLGFLTAIDDFGAGYSGLNLLAEFQPDIIKLDMALIRGIDSNRPRQAIVRGIAQVCAELGIRVIAEGIETAEELKPLRDFGITLFQGYYFARPQFEGLAAVKTA